MIVHAYPLGPMENVVYILEDSKSAAIVDPAWDIPFLVNQLQEKKLSLSCILLTHGHHDHVNGLQEIKTLFPDVPVYLSHREAVHLTPKIEGLKKVKARDTLRVGNATITCIETPGHSPGGMCYSAPPHLITGDTLFINGCGRCDFESSNVEDMWESLLKIKALSDDTLIYPGHGYGDLSQNRLGDLKSHNRFLNCKTKEIFIRKRMGIG